MKIRFESIVEVLFCCVCATVGILIPLGFALLLFAGAYKLLMG